MRKRYVYFIKEKIGMYAPVKIGYATDVQRRLDDLQIGNSRTLEIVATIGPITLEHAKAIEIGLHDKFRKHRIRGEWFTGVVLNKLDSISEPLSTERIEP